MYESLQYFLRHVGYVAVFSSYTITQMSLQRALSRPANISTGQADCNPAANSYD